ncbi:MAG: hypothetical protein AAB881_01460 [Patescibacteria group bacterium]
MKVPIEQNLEQKKENKSEAFYKEMDRARIGSSISLSVILFLFFIILAVGILYVVYARGVFVIDGSPLNLSSIWTKTSKNTPPASEGNVVRINEEDLGRDLKINDPSFPVKKANLTISNSGILLIGKTGESFLSLKIEIKILPKVENEKLILSIAEIKSAGVVAPKSIIDIFTPQINTILENTKITDGKVKDVRLFPKYMEIELAE